MGAGAFNGCYPGDRSLVHWLTNYAHGQVTLVAMSLINLLFTVVAPLYAWVLVGESIGGWQAAGMGLVLAALTMVVSRPIEAAPR